MARDEETMLKRLLGRVEYDTAGGCWLWCGKMANLFYGAIRHGKPYVLVHRLSWELHNGPIPDGVLVLHRCDTPLCVNPHHLFLGSHADNGADKARKGRGVGGLVRGERHWRAKLTAERVALIKARRARERISQEALGREFGVSQGAVSQILLGKTWASKPVHNNSARFVNKLRAA